MHSLVRWTCLWFVLAPAAACGEPERPAPSFDCGQATGQVEELICQDAGLTALDNELSAVYAKAVKSGPADVAAEQRTLQRGWIKGRNECWKAEDVRACTEASYRTRIVELQIRSGQLQAPASVGYACTGGDAKPFTAAFYTDTEPASVVLTHGDDQVIAFTERSASGARYTASNVEFWEHQGEAAVDWFGTRLTCRPRTTAREARASLVGTTWRLVQFQSMDDTTLRPDASERYSLTFGDDGKLQLQAGCNRGQASWTSEDDVSLAIGPVALTRALCPASPIQDRFVRDLDFVRSYVVADGHLYLSLMADGGIYEFEPLPEGAAP